MTYREDMASPTGAQRRELQLPESGPGSAGGIGRRIAALFIDWFASLLIAALINGGYNDGRFDQGLLTLAIFYLQVTVLTWSFGSAFGQRILGLVVAPVGRPRVGLPAVALRTFLLCLVIPAVVMQPNGRGLHDLAAGTVVVRR